MLIAFTVACLAQAFQQFMKPGQIFNFWGIFLSKKSKDSSKVFDRLIAKLAKPLGLCPYCNATWIAILYYILIYIVNQPFYLITGVMLFGFIGVVWFFVFLIENKLTNPQKK